MLKEFPGKDIALCTGLLFFACVNISVADLDGMLASPNTLGTNALLIIQTSIWTII